MSGEPTILGCPVVDGRAETPMGVVEISLDVPGPTTVPAARYARWILPGGFTAEIGYGDALDDGGPEAGAIRRADRVLRALSDAAIRSAGLVRSSCCDAAVRCGRCGAELGRTPTAIVMPERADAIERGEP